MNQLISLNKRSQGLTLIELLVTLSLLSILFFFSTLLTHSFYKKNQFQIISDEIKMAIYTAKMQALMTRDTLVLTPLSGEGDWSHGMLLFVDNGTHHFIPNDPLLHQWHWASPDIQISWHGFQSKNYLLFAADIRRSTTNGYFMIKNNLHQQVKLIINRVARVRQIN